MAKNFLQNAVHPSRKGQFTRKAKAAGMSVAQYAKHVLASGSGASTRTKRQAVFAQNASAISKKHAKKKRRNAKTGYGHMYA